MFGREKRLKKIENDIGVLRVQLGLDTPGYTFEGSTAVSMLRRDIEKVKDLVIENNTITVKSFIVPIPKIGAATISFEYPVKEVIQMLMDTLDVKLHTEQGVPDQKMLVDK